MIAPSDDLAVYGTPDPPVVDVPVHVADPLAGMPSMPVMVRPSSRGSFFRIVGARPADVDGWWRRTASHGEVVVDHRLRLAAPRDVGGGARSMPGALRRPATHRWVPVEIQLRPHVGAVSILTADPGRRVRAGRFWFRSGHRALARFAAAVCEPLAP